MLLCNWKYGDGMDQEKVGKFIREIRKKNHLTQAQLASRYGVTFQAVSKWENGKNMPDVSLLKQMSEDFHVNIEDILDGNIPSNKVSRRKSFPFQFIIPFVLILILILFVILYFNQEKGFEFRTLSSSCSQFDIYGSIAYDDKKSSIYISNIHYCGEEDLTYYQSIECILYESNDDVDTKISTYYYDDSDDDLRGCEKGKRTSAFVPITATHSADNLYLESSISLEEVAVTVKDEWGYVVYEAITPLFADEQAAFPLNLSEGCYTLEIKYGGVCLLGNFDL